MTDSGTLDAFVVRLDTAMDLGTVKDMLDQEIVDRGFGNFAYLQLRVPRGLSQRLYIGSYPTDWSTHYRDSELQIHDPTHDWSFGTTRPFLWDDLKQHEGFPTAEKLVFGPSAEFGLRSGAGFPIHGPDGTVAAFHVAMDCPAADFLGAFRAHRHEIQLIAAYAHERILALTSKEKDFIAQFTPRQREVLLWTVRGKTNWEIGEILDISEDTVRQHLRAVSVKLDASNRAQAAAIAITRHIVLL